MSFQCKSWCFSLFRR